MTASRHRGIWNGLFVSAMVTAALIGILFVGWRVAGLPFVPFDGLDRLTRVFPGRVIAFGIGTMVTVIRALNLSPTSETAKTAEQAMAVSGFFVAAGSGIVRPMAMIRWAPFRFAVLRARTGSRVLPRRATARATILGVRR